MPVSLIEAKRRALQFLAEEIGYDPAAIRVTGLSREEGVWRVKVEITAPDAYLSKLGYPPVFNRLESSVEVDAEGEIVGFNAPEKGGGG